MRAFRNILAGVVFFSLSPAYAAGHLPTDLDRSPPICVTGPTASFKGITHIYVDAHVGFGPNDEKAFDTLIPRDARSFLVQETTNDLNEIFVEASHRRTMDLTGLKIDPVSDPSNYPEHSQDPKVLVIEFNFSTHPDKFNGKAIKVASIGVVRRKDAEGGSATQVDVANFPFIIPDTKEELQKRIKAGIIFLTYHFPSEYYCNNHDNATAYCMTDSRYGQKWKYRSDGIRFVH
jgi:hypothetical protein